MARKSKKAIDIVTEADAPVLDQKITDTIEKNYMPYAMSVIISRAIPEIDGFKPAHRKILYTMYKMGLMTGQRTKSANVVGQTMKLNPHGDQSIYDTLVRLSRGNESLLHPFIDSKGNFGKQYSSDAAYAAARYTEVKLEKICEQIFGGINEDAVDFVPNYDNTMTEPVLLPTAFPNVLVSPNTGIAVGMASKICSFNLAEICDGTIQLLKDPKTTAEQMLDIIKAPDFPGGAYIIYDREQLLKIYETGKGNVKVRARYNYDPQDNCIDIVQIPYSTSVEIIMKKMTELIKEGKLKDVTDFRDEIDLNGFKLSVDIRRGADPVQVMSRLYSLTTLEDDFPCNFNVLIDGSPVQTGVIEILKEWIKFRIGCVKRELSYTLKKKEDKLHLLLALGQILLDIDKAIKIVRETKNDKDVVPNLMSGFGIDEVQAEYIAEIKLRNLNKEYILNRISEIERLQAEISDLQDLVSSEQRLKTYIAKQLRDIKQKFGMPRKSQIIYDSAVEDKSTEKEVESYPVKIFLSNEGYFKKITPLSLRGNDEQKFKDDDSLRTVLDADNSDEILFFSDKARCYKGKIDDFECTKSSALGDYVGSKFGFESNEKCIFMLNLKEYSSDKYIIFIFENGKAVKIPVSAYETKSARKKLTNAYSEASPIVGIFYEGEGCNVMMVSDNGKAIVINSSLISSKTTRTTQGNNVFTLKKGQKITEAYIAEESPYPDSVKKYRKIKVPASGTTVDKK